MLLLQSSGAITLHERLSWPSFLSSLASKGDAESLSFALQLQAPGVPFLVGELRFAQSSAVSLHCTETPLNCIVGRLLFAAISGSTQHKSDCVAIILRHLSSKIASPGAFPFLVVEDDDICAAIIKAFADS